MEGVIADFSIPQKQGIEQAIDLIFPGRGKEFIESKFKGFHVHFKRTVIRLVQALALDETTATAFKKLAFKVLEFKEEKQIVNVLNASSLFFCGEKPAKKASVMASPPQISSPSVSRQLRMVAEDAKNGSPLQRSTRAGRFSLDSLLQ